MSVFRLPSERVPITVDEGPSVEVERIGAWPIYWTALRLLGAATTATDAPAILAALQEAYGFFLAEAQPVMAIADHRGVLPTTVTGLLRLPVPMGLGLVTAWIEDFNRTPPESAVDAAVEPGPLRDALNSELRRKRKGG